MEVFQSIVLGVIQGASEFLPISSSGHLILIPSFFNWDDQGLAFDVALHLGTTLAVLAYFWKDWRDIVISSFLLRKIKDCLPHAVSLGEKAEHKSHFRMSKTNQKRAASTCGSLESDLLFVIIIATIPGAAVGLLFGNYAETVFRSPGLVAFTLLFGALFLFYSDRKGNKKLDFQNPTLKEGVIVGFFQALAIIPGVSRSGITITAALLLGANRKLAARFSFLLSTPIILGAGIKEFPSLIQSSFLDVNIFIGIASAAASGYLAIRYMLKYLQNRSYDIFVAYRIVLAVFIIIQHLSFAV